MLNTNKLDIKVTTNFIDIRLKLLFLPVLLLFIIGFFLFKENAFSVEGYIRFQEDSFFYLNSKLAQLPTLQHNLTQLGDALILFSLMTLFIIYAPKLWGVILTSGIISLLVSFVLKKIFAVPRPAAIFDNDSFVIVGQALKGHTSLPSGHSITTFIIITILLFAFMPKGLKHKIAWSVSILALGLVIVFSRVGVGAHFPLDVIIGSILGYVIALFGIVINNKITWWNWIENKKYYPIFILLLIACGVVIVKKITTDNLGIFYFSLFSIVLTLYIMIKIYAKKGH